MRPGSRVSKTPRLRAPSRAGARPPAPHLSETPRHHPGLIVMFRTSRPARTGPRTRTLQFHLPAPQTQRGPGGPASPQPGCPALPARKPRPSCRASTGWMPPVDGHAAPDSGPRPGLSFSAHSNPPATPGRAAGCWAVLGQGRPHRGAHPGPAWREHSRLGKRARPGARSTRGRRHRAVRVPQPEPAKQGVGETGGALGEESGGHQSTAHRRSPGTGTLLLLPLQSTPTVY